MQQVMNKVVMHVRLTGVRTLKVRLWLGKSLIILAARVMGCRVEIE